jgi:hypothetical protein
MGRDCGGPKCGRRGESMKEASLKKGGGPETKPKGADKLKK